MTGAEACLHAKFHLDPSNGLATIHQHHIGQRSDSTGRIVLQTVAQKLNLTTKTHIHQSQEMYYNKINQKATAQQ